MLLYQNYTYIYYLVVLSYHELKTRMRIPAACLDKDRHDIQDNMLNVLSQFKITLINSVHKHSWNDHIHS